MLYFPFHLEGLSVLEDTYPTLSVVTHSSLWYNLEHWFMLMQIDREDAVDTCSALILRGLQ